MGEAWINHEGEKVRRAFLEVLASRRKDSVPLTIIPSERKEVAFLQRELSLINSPIIDSSPRGDVDHSEPNFKEENVFITTEAGEQGRVPVLIIRPVKQDTKQPAVVLLHGTGQSKEMFRPYLQAYAARGYVAVAIDSRYHGERATSVDSYSNALISAWRTGKEMPFVYDTQLYQWSGAKLVKGSLGGVRDGVHDSSQVWDVIKLVDYLSERQDVDPARIGVMGISLGGMHAWFAAVADPRIDVVVPIIGVQNFGWAVYNEKWHARVQSIPHAFEVAKEDLGKTTLDAETVIAVWQRLAPGLMDRFDADHTIPAIAPRPLLIINGEQDPRCPMEGLEKMLIEAAEVYKTAGVPNHFKFKAEEGVYHSFIESMGYDASIWMDKFLKPEKPLRQT